MIADLALQFDVSGICRGETLVIGRVERKGANGQGTQKEKIKRLALCRHVRSCRARALIDL